MISKNKILDIKSPSLSHNGVVLAVCVRLKNEGLYLREWIEFHRLAGVDFFHVFDDASQDATV